MSQVGGSTASSSVPTAPPHRNQMLRVHGIVIVVLVVVEVLIGNALAVAGSPYPALTLDAHVGVAALLVLVTVGAVVVSVRQRATWGRVAAVVAFVASLGAAISGTVFLQAGMATAPLDAMESLAGVALLGGLLLIVWGSSAVPARAS